MYILKEITGKETWNNFITTSWFKFYSFLQSWEWWEFQKLANKSVKRLGIYKESILVWVLQVIEVRAKRGNYYFIPHGPLIQNNFFEVLYYVIPILKEQAKKNKIDFIRLNSTVENTIENKQKYRKLWFINAPMHEHAEDTHLLDLMRTEEELLNNIKKKDRYYINRAIKEWVQVRIDNELDHINKLINMHHNHASRVGYHKFPKAFIYNLYEVFWKNISTISTSYNWNIESILMTIKFWDTCVYYIAASNIISHKFSPNYLCQWEAIKKAKQDGAKLYNFWGVSPDDNSKHPIAWVTKFKRKFWWYDYSLLHAQDLVLSPKYYINCLIETCRSAKRGYYYKKPL